MQRVHLKGEKYMSHFCAALRGLTVTLGICLTAATTPAQELVTRNDFTCSDTTTPLYWLGFWPEVAIDAKGNINEVNLVFLDTVGEDVWCHQYTKFDRFGHQMQPVVTFLPDSSNADTVWNTYGIARIDCNDEGTVVIPYRVRNGPAYPLYRRFMALFDPLGMAMGEPICATCRPQETFTYMPHPRGMINNNGLAGMIWRSHGCQVGLPDSVWIRLYDTKTDSLYPLWRPTVEAQPFSAYCGREAACLGIADDGHVAAAWIAEKIFAHIYYTVYNADGTQAFPITMVDCDAGFYDSAACVSSYTITADMAMEPDGDFYISWYDRQFSYQDVRAVSGHVWMRGFNSDGTPKYNAMRVTDTDSTWLIDYQLVDTKIACDTAGNVLVMWSDSRLWPETDTSGLMADVFLQKIDPAGNLVGPNFRVNDIGGVAGLFGTHCSADMNNAGQVVVIWRNYLQPDNVPSIKAQLMAYDAVGRFVPGDINYDLSADVADLSNLVDYMFRGGRNTFWPRDLINLDGVGGDEVNISDLVCLVNYLFGGGPPPATPYEGIRPDPGPVQLPGKGAPSIDQPLPDAIPDPFDVTQRQQSM